MLDKQRLQISSTATDSGPRRKSLAERRNGCFTRLAIPWIYTIPVDVLYLRLVNTCLKPSLPLLLQ